MLLRDIISGWLGGQGKAPGVYVLGLGGERGRGLDGSVQWLTGMVRQDHGNDTVLRRELAVEFGLEVVPLDAHGGQEIGQLVAFSLQPGDHGGLLADLIQQSGMGCGRSISAACALFSPQKSMHITYWRRRGMLCVLTIPQSGVG